MQQVNEAKPMKPMKPKQNQQETAFQQEVLVLIYSNLIATNIQGVFSCEENLDEYLEQHTKVLEERFYDMYSKKLSKKEAELAAKAEAKFSIANYYVVRKFTLH